MPQLRTSSIGHTSFSRRRRGRLAVAAAALAVVAVVTPVTPLVIQPAMAALLSDGEGSTDADLLKLAELRVGAAEYQAALEALGQIDPANLSDAGRAQLAELQARATSALDSRDQARADLAAGEAAFEAGNFAVAAAAFDRARDARFADAATQQKAAELLAVTEAELRDEITREFGSDRAYYDSAVADFEAERFDDAEVKLAALAAINYQAGAFGASPDQLLGEIATRRAPAAAAAPEAVAPPAPVDPVMPPAVEPVEEPEAAVEPEAPVEPEVMIEPPAAPEVAEISAARVDYLRGIKAWQDNRFVEAKELLTKAEAAGYEPELFETPIAQVLDVVEQRLAREAERAEAPVADADDAARREANAAFERGRALEDAGRPDEARAAYQEAARLNPSFQPASDDAPGADPVAPAANQSPATPFIDKENAQRQLITFKFDEAIENGEAALAANEFQQARTFVEQARVAASTNPFLFSAATRNQFDTRIEGLSLAIDRKEATVEARRVDEARRRAEGEDRKRQLEGEAAEAATVRRLIRDAQLAVEDGKFEAALALIEQILTVDPNNDYAIGVRPFIEDKALLARQRKHFLDYRQEVASVMTEAQEKRIPYDEILRYPEDWPDLVARRDRTVAEERGAEEADAALIAQLEAPIDTPVEFDQVPFDDVVDFLRNASNAGIFVNWPELELSGIQRGTEVTLQLPGSASLGKVIELTLNQLGSGFAELDYTVDDGIITISSVEDLSKNVQTQVLDIRDLIVPIPDFDQQDVGNLGGAGGGGGGGGGFGGGGGGGGGFGGGG
ncbi:MAG: tetratricopeptide repeat protein, partial [Planctomycetota bacterium]